MFFPCLICVVRSFFWLCFFFQHSFSILTVLVPFVCFCSFLCCSPLRSRDILEAQNTTIEELTRMLLRTTSPRTRARTRTTRRRTPPPPPPPTTTTTTTVQYLTLRGGPAIGTIAFSVGLQKDTPIDGNGEWFFFHSPRK